MELCSGAEAVSALSATACLPKGDSVDGGWKETGSARRRSVQAMTTDGGMNEVGVCERAACWTNN